METLLTAEYLHELKTNNIKIKKWYDNSSTHRHDFFEILYVKKGHITHSINDKPYIEMYPGDYMFIDIGSHHTFYMKDSEIINVEFTSHAISKHLPMCNNVFQLLSYSAFSTLNASGTKYPADMVLHDDDGLLSKHIDLLDAEINSINSSETILGSHIIKHHLIAMMMHIAAPFHRPAVSSIENTLVRKMLEIIAFHYSDPNPLTIAANQLSYSTSTLSSLFKENVGVNFKEYVQRFRIDKAKYLLTSTNATLSVISSDVGYSDTKFFSKLFKMYEGVTPTEYRSKHKNHIPIQTLCN